MKILQLCGDWKWTGPAEPMVWLTRALRNRGHEVSLACASPADHTGRSLVDEASRRGVEPAMVFPPGRGLRIRADAATARRLRSLLAREAFDAVHVWHTRDHALALRARGRDRSLRIVRSMPSADPPRAWPWNRWLLGPGCDVLVCVSHATARAFADFRRGRPLVGCLWAVDSRHLAGSREQGRATLGLDSEAPVIGIVARAQRHRRFDLLFEAMARLAETHPDARLVVVGRGTHFEEVVRQPVARLGIGDRVVEAGYRTDDYADVLRAFDLITYLVPGSDGSCRALLEAAACGIPAVATRRGALPETVLDGETGVLVDESPEALAGAWKFLLDDAAARMQMGEAARERAARTFDPARWAEEMEAAYSASPPIATSSR